jgi:methionyl-tRNA formyltransferase
MQRVYPITDEDNYNTLLEKAYIECANILYDSIKFIQKAEKIIPIKQNSIHPIGFYCSQRKEGDEILDWNQTSKEIFNFVRAICKPGPTARAFINNKEMKINKVEYIKNAPSYKGIIGAILNKDNTGFLIKTKDSYIKIIDFEYDGKFKVGDRFE